MRSPRLESAGRESCFNGQRGFGVTEAMDSVIVYIHVICGAAFAVTMAVQQLVVGPAMSVIPAGDEKRKAAGIVQARARTAMDAAIIIQTVTSIILLITRWDMIAASHLMHIKIFLGVIALIFANLLHFYWRGKKRRLKERGETDRFSALNRRTLIIEKAVLAAALLAFLMGAAFNHL